MTSSEHHRNLKKLSHSLSWALRHAAPDLGMTMTPDGFCPVDELLSVAHPKFKGNWTVEDVHRVVETSDKQRYKLEIRPGVDYGRNEESLLCIRANQGHSIPGINPDLLLSRLSPEELASIPIVVHGTYNEAWNVIKTKGLSRMTRNHIHFASGIPGCDNVISGMRRSCDIYIYINAKKCAQDGITFYKSENGVLLTAGSANEGILPTDYFSHVTDRSGTILLDRRAA